MSDQPDTGHGHVRVLPDDPTLDTEAGRAHGERMARIVELVRDEALYLLDLPLARPHVQLVLSGLVDAGVTRALDQQRIEGTL